MKEALEHPVVEVLDSEYNRLLGLPPDFVPDDRLLELAEWARSWYAEHGRPWTYSSPVQDLFIDETAFGVKDVLFHGEKTLDRLKKARAFGCILAAVSAGHEVEEEARRRWSEDHPDEYYFLEMYGSAVVENLITELGARLCEWADSEGWAVLPHYSPGYTGWDLEDQAALFRLTVSGVPQLTQERIRLLSSGMLKPRKSQLTLFGLTAERDLVGEIADLAPCEDCAFAPCRFRRSPYKWRIYEEAGGRIFQPGDNGALKPTDVPPLEKEPDLLSRNVNYAFSSKVLQKWAEARMTITAATDGGVQARFRYEGSTCNNLGFPILMDYEIRLSPASDGYRILSTSCSPASEDEGFSRTCGFSENPVTMNARLEEEHPLIGSSLAEVVNWNPESSPSGCWCNLSDRNHKWKAVFQTLHYWLAQGSPS